MRFARLFLVFTLSSITTACTETTKQNCAEVEVLDFRGAGQNSGLSEAGMLLSELGDGSINVSAAGPTVDVNDIEREVEEAEQWIDTVRKECSQSQLVLSGYSRGAWIVHEALQGASDDVWTFMIADPLRDPSKTGISHLDLDGSVEGVGDLIAYEGETARDLPEELAVKRVSICRRGDWVCNSEMPRGEGTAHFGYGSSEEVKEIAKRFIQSLLSETSSKQ